MKIGALVLLLTLTPCLALYQAEILQHLSANSNAGDFSAECQQALFTLFNFPTFEVEESRRTCLEPELRPKQVIHASCPVTGSWKAACKSAGGSVCDLDFTAKGAHIYGSTFKISIDAPICIPTACYKGKNLDTFEDIIESQSCSTFTASKCDADIKCGGKAGLIALAVILSLVILGAASVGGFFIWKRYYAANGTQATATVGDFHEYSELAQYEEEESDIIADSEIDGEGDEVHSIN